MLYSIALNRADEEVHNALINADITVRSWDSKTVEELKNLPANRLRPNYTAYFVVDGYATDGYTENFEADMDADTVEAYTDLTTFIERIKELQLIYRG